MRFPTGNPCQLPVEPIEFCELDDRLGGAGKSFVMTSNPGDDGDGIAGDGARSGRLKDEGTARSPPLKLDPRRRLKDTGCVDTLKPLKEPDPLRPGCRCGRTGGSSSDSCRMEDIELLSGCGYVEGRAVELCTSHLCDCSTQLCARMFASHVLGSSVRGLACLQWTEVDRELNKQAQCKTDEDWDAQSGARDNAEGIIAR